MITLNEAEAVKIGFFAVEEKDYSRIFQALDSLTGIAAGFLSKNEEADVQRIIHSIEGIAKAAAENKMELVTINSALALGKLARTAAEKGSESILSEIFIAIGKLGIAAATNSLETGSKVAATTLMEIWKFSPQAAKPGKNNYLFRNLKRNWGFWRKTGHRGSCAQRSNRSGRNWKKGSIRKP